MIKYQLYSPSQIIQVSSVISLVQTYPVIQQAQAIISVTAVDFLGYDSQSLFLMSNIFTNTQKTLDWITQNMNATLASVQYIMPVSVACTSMANQCALVSIGATGTQTVSLTLTGSNAYEQLQLWDPVQGYDAPSSPDVIALSMLLGLQNL